MTARAEIDLNVRTRTGTYTGMEDITGDYDVGDVIYVVEPESGLWGNGLVTSIDHTTQLVYISLAWNTLSAPLAPEPDLMDELVRISQGPHPNPDDLS